MKKTWKVWLGCIALASFMTVGCGDDINGNGNGNGDSKECSPACKDDEVCKEGKCVPKDEGNQGNTDEDKCKSVGMTTCGEGCVDVKTNPIHCGKCDNACPAGSLCVDGECKLNCSNEQKACGDQCVDLKTNPDHCGECGNSCGDSQVCKDGECSTSCPDGWEVCDGTCFDLKTDENNCGKCGTKCDVEKGMTCVDSVCTCNNDQKSCDGVCISVKNDSNNCGDCGQKCDEGFSCVNGSCDIVCALNEQKCGSECKNTNNDNQNCGACGNACKEDETCKQGVCDSNCTGGKTQCDDQLCYDLSSDFNHCGACDIVCQTGEVCNEGKCDKEGCKDGLLECDGSCIDKLTNNQHCGACNSPCADEFECVDGVCGCPRSQTYCITKIEDEASIKACIDAQNDDSACGCTADALGLNCTTLPNTAEGAMCQEGTCNFECLEGYADCDKDPSNGCEAELNTDVKNCKECGTVCEAEHASDNACVVGVCSPTCEDEYTDCNGKCINTDEDPKNCGACGNSCGEGFSCRNGYCMLDKCTLENGTYAKVNFGGKEIKAYCVTDEDEFAKVRDAVNSGSKYPVNNPDNAYILIGDLDFSSTSWRGIGISSTYPFNGIFLGNGRSITGSITCNSQYCGIFGYAQNATLTGFNVDIRINSAQNYTGGLVGYAASSDINNSTINGSIRGGAYTGGVVGATNSGNVTSCKTIAPVTATNTHAGGIVGHATKTVISGNIVEGSNISGSNSNVGGIVGTAVTSEITENQLVEAKLNNANSYTGGIVGHASATTPLVGNKASGRILTSSSYTGLIAGYMTDSSAENCVVSNGSVNATGSFTGVFAGYINTSKVTNCTTKATTTSTGSYVGGFIGQTSGACSIKGSSSTGDVFGASYVGGFVGYSTTGADFNNCNSKSDVTASSYYAGGFAGYLSNSQARNTFATGNVTCTGGYYVGGHTGVVDNSNYRDSYATGNVSATLGSCYYGAGGFFGFAQNNSEFTKCYATGHVTGGGATGGFGGYAYTGVHSITQCAAFGNVTNSSCGFASSFIGTSYSGTTNIDTSMAVGDVKKSANYSGGFLASPTSNHGTVNISDSYITGLVGTTGNRGAITATTYVSRVKATDTYYWSQSSDKVSQTTLIFGSNPKPFNYSKTKAVVVSGEEELSLTEVLNANRNVWEEAKCTLTTGPVNKIEESTFTIPVLKGATPSFCKK